MENLLLGRDGDGTGLFFEPEDDDATVKSAKRVLQILELFKTIEEPMSTTDIAVQLNYPISSTAALLKSLTSLGYVVFDRPSRTYRASLRIALLGDVSCQGGFDTQRLNHISTRLAQASGLAAVIGIRNNNHVQYVRVVAETGPVRFYLPVGSRQRLVDTAMGRALLSIDDDIAIDRLVRRANADRRPSQPRIDPAELKADIAGIRRNGYSCSIDRFFKGAGAVAAPLGGSGGEMPLVLGVGGVAEQVRAKLDRLIELVVGAANEMQRCTMSPDETGLIETGDCARIAS